MAKEVAQNLALYRKYRPSSFDDVLGQDHIVKVLQSAIEKKNIAHAYLFAGSRGTGKTSIARIFASEVGAKGNDIYEIDGASNRGIDEARAIREAVNTLPFESPYKVYIVDEAHMLTKDAWNALLKTLEEPPAHVIFMFATTELEKVPETILSRCQSFTFKKPSMAILKEVVSRIAKKEGYTLPSESADLIAFLAEGSFRDAQGILQKVLSFSKDKKVSIEEVELVAGAPKRSLVEQFVKALATRDVQGALQAVHTASKENIGMPVFLKMVLHMMRSVLLVRFAPDMKDDVLAQFAESDRDFLVEMSGKAGAGINSKSLLMLLEAHEQMMFSTVPELPLELAIARMAESGG
jgi:DNA polymerase-3 subunit gamma/tau